MASLSIGTVQPRFSRNAAWWGSLSAIAPIRFRRQEIDMKKMMFAASAALLIAAPAFAFAQDDHHHEGGAPPAPHAAAAPPSRPAGPPQGAPAYHPQGGPPGGYHTQGGPTFPGGQGGYRPQAGQPSYHQPGGPTFPGGQGGYRPQPGQPGYRQPGFQGGQPGGGYHGGFNPGGPVRSGGQSFGYGGHQFFRYQAPAYRFPGGYGGWANHAWRRGEWLPPVFIASTYFINDWYDFGLWQPDYGYEWIRVGVDAVLVNLADGQVVDVVPGVYYY
jgi:hypothetical protein